MVGVDTDLVVFTKCGY